MLMLMLLLLLKVVIILAKRGQFEYRQNVSYVYFSLVRDRSTDTVQPSPVYYMRYSVP